MKNFFCQLCRALAGILLELHELHNISRSYVAILISESAVIRVKFLHHLELLLSHSHNNDAQRKAGSLDEKAFGLLHVMNLSVSDDKEYVVEALRASRVDDVDHLLDNAFEISRAAESNSVERLPVQLMQTHRSEYLGIRVVPVQREAMISCIFAHEARNSSETVDWEAPVIVVNF